MNSQDGGEESKNRARFRWARGAAARNFFLYTTLAGVLLVLLHESLFGGKGLVPADTLLNWPPWNHAGYPAERPSNHLLTDQYCVFLPQAEFEYQQKSFPLWNPYLCCGVPNLGNIQGAPLFPIRWLLSSWDPFSASGPAAFLKLCLAGWFTILYLRLLGASRSAAFLSGLVFSLSSFMIVWLGHPHVNCAMWLPILLFFVEKSFKQEKGNTGTKTTLRCWIGFAVAFAFMILGGHPPTAVHVTILVGLYFVFRVVEHRRDQPLRRVALLAGAVAVGLLLAAPQILPFLEYYRQSSSPQSSVSMARWSYHLVPRSLIHFLLPNVLGNPAIGFEELPKLLGWPEKGNFSENTAYAGILPLYLAACALFLRRCQFTKFFAAVAFGSMLVVFGVPPLPMILHWLPILKDMSHTRLILFIDFSVAVLAGLGWDQLRRVGLDRGIRLVAMGFCAAVGLVVFYFWQVTGAKIEGLDATYLAFVRSQFLLLAGGMIAILSIAFWPAPRHRAIPTFLCLGWTAIDLLSFAYGYNPSIPRARYYPSTPALAWMQKDPSAFRIFGGGEMLCPNSAEVFGLSDARGCDYLTVRRYEELITGKSGHFEFYKNATEFPKTFPLLNVKYVLTENGFTLDPLLFDLVYSNEISIYRYKECRDRALVVFNYQVETNSARVLNRVSSPGFDPRRLLLLEDQPAQEKQPPSPPTTETNAAGSVRITSYRPDDVTLEASLPRPGFLLLLDTYFPGWSATVNGARSPIYRADYNFRAVSLPTGKSTVDFSYRPKSLKIGLFLCAGGIFILGMAWFLPLNRKTKEDNFEQSIGESPNCAIQDI